MAEGIQARDDERTVDDHLERTLELIAKARAVIFVASDSVERMAAVDDALGGADELLESAAEAARRALAGAAKASAKNVCTPPEGTAKTDKSPQPGGAEGADPLDPLRVATLVEYARAVVQTDGLRAAALAGLMRAASGASAVATVEGRSA